MMTAREARYRSVENERDLIRKNILTAVELRKNHCWINLFISHTAKQWLESLGYSVVRICSENDSKTQVRW